MMQLLVNTESTAARRYNDNHYLSSNSPSLLQTETHNLSEHNVLSSPYNSVDYYLGNKSDT